MVGEITKHTAKKTMLLPETFWSRQKHPQNDEYNMTVIKNLDLNHVNECSFIGRLLRSTRGGKFKRFILVGLVSTVSQTENNITKKYKSVEYKNLLLEIQDSGTSEQA